MQCQVLQVGQLVAGVFRHVAEHTTQGLWALQEDQTEHGQQATDPVKAVSAFFLVAFTQTVNPLPALLRWRLHGCSTRTRPRGGLVDCCSIIGIVLAAGALHAEWPDEVGRDQPDI
ncbi:hypothetical protein DBR47_07455 [Paucibacter sp. KBW04]|nr:hypothetical protein DBR47_07455 [Paucibacter sp. KBW04]